MRARYPARVTGWLVPHCLEPEGERMSAIPHVVPKYASQPAGVPWPTDEWPRGTIARQSELEGIVDELFTHDDLAVTNGVVVIQLSLIHISEPTRQAEISYAV